MCVVYIYNMYINKLTIALLMLSGLYNGFGWLALGRMPGLAARFGTYEILTAFYKGIFIYINIYIQQ